MTPCTGNRGKCEEPYTRQEILAREFAEVLQELVIPLAILEWLGNDVLTSDQTEQAARAQGYQEVARPVRANPSAHRDDVLGEARWADHPGVFRQAIGRLPRRAGRAAA